MKRYLLFGGQDKDMKEGGARDFMGDYDTLEDAKNLGNMHYEWADIFTVGQDKAGHTTFELVCLYRLWHNSKTGEVEGLWADAKDVRSY